MADKKHDPERNCHLRQKWLPAASILLLVLLAAVLGIRYISFVSQTIYQESTSHLEEVLHKSNHMLKEMVRKNLTGFLQILQQNDGLPDIITCCRFSLHDAAPLKDSLMNLATTNEAGAVYNTYLNSFKTRTAA